MLLTINKKKTLALSFFLLYYFLLSYVYYMYVAALFAYSGHVRDLNIGAIAIACASVFMATSLIPKVDDARARIIVILEAVWLVPGLVFFSVGQGGGYYYIVLMSSFLLVIFFSSFKVPIIRLAQLEPFLLSRLMITVSVLYLFAVIGFGGLEFINFNLGEVYEYRESASSNLPQVFGYFSPIVTKIILPVYVVLSVINGRRLEAVLGFSVSFLFFGLTSHKAPIFYPAVILATYWASGKNLSMIIPLGLSVLIAICGIDFYLGGLFGESPWLGSLLVRRALMTSPLINHFYLDFFSDSAFYYWADSKFSLGLVESPYFWSAPHVIGDYYFGSSAMSANAGFLGSGYANAGLLGTYIYAALVGIIISLLSGYGSVIGPRTVTSISVIVLISVFNSTDLTTALLTHGLIGLIILLSIMPKSLNVPSR